MGQAAQRLGGSTGDEVRSKPVHRDAAQPAGREEALADGALVEQSPSSIAPERDALPRRERDRVADVLLERNEPALAREDVLVLRLHVPQRSQAERIDAEDARVADADEDPGRPLRDR